MKILYVTTVGSTMGFFKDFFKELINDGHTVELASNETELDYSDEIKSLGLKAHHLDCSRSPFSFGNIKCIKQIKQIVEENGYDIVHCHTPIAAACTRFACKDIRKKRYSTEKPLRVLYTAHGFHFFKGASIKNWLLFYPVEKICSHFTDIIVTINQEDYERATKKFTGSMHYSLDNCKVAYVPGVGIDLKKFNCESISTEEIQGMRQSLGVQKDSMLLLSVGELIHRKNHEVVIKALSQLEEQSWVYCIAGTGILEGYLSSLIEQCGLTDRVKLLGFRKDVSLLCSCADLFILPSFQEGLPVALMEAIATKTPVICSGIRGNSDLVTKESLFDEKDVESVRKKLEYALSGGEFNVEENLENLQKFSIEKVNEGMKELYFGVQKC